MILFCCASVSFGQSDSLAVPDSLKKDSLTFTAVQRDSIVLDSLRKTSDLKAPLKYKAEDSIVIDLKNNILYMYNGAQTDYQEQVLDAKYIRVDMKSNLIHAEGEYDSQKDSLVGSPVFNDKGQIYKSEKITYNYTTRKGKIAYANTKQGTDFIIGDSIKRTPDNVFYVKGGKFTTCDHPEPHFYIKAFRLKMIPNDRIVTGPLYMVVADVPIPIIFPFGFFPFNNKRTSGIILPQYGDTPDRGFSLRDFGYYQAINDYMDATLKATVFTNGSYILNLNPRYRWNYHLSGNMNILFSRESFNEKTDADYRETNQYNIQWSHQQTVNPNASLNASVNVGSSKSLQRTTFQLQDNLRSNLNSSIAYQHRFNRYGWNLTANLSQTQSVGTGSVATMSFDLPNIVLNKDRMFLLKKKERVGKERWYEKIGTTYSANILNQIRNLPDSLLFTQELWKRMQNGMNQRVSINTNFKLLNYINISPALNYTEYWYARTIEKEVVRDQDTIIFQNGEPIRIPNKNIVVRDKNVDGFASGRDFNFGLNAATQLFGILQTNSKRQRAFRHTMNLSGGYTFRPDFADPSWGFYKYNPATRDLSRPEYYSRFAGGVAGGPSAGEQQSLNFNMGNVVEMKYLPTPAEGDTAKPKFKNVTLIDNFGFGFAYNFAQDSFQLSNINWSFRNNVLDNLVNINVSGNLDPYKYAFNGNTMVRKNQFSWLGDNGAFPLLTNLSFSAGTQFKPREKKPAKKDTEKKELTPRESYDLLYEVFNMPWTLNVNYTGSWSQGAKGGGERGFREQLTQSVSLTGSLQVTAKWKVNMTANISFGGGRKLELGASNIQVERDLHCWVLKMDVVPFGTFRRYLLTLNVRAATLQDLRIQKQRNWQDQVGSF